MYSVYWAVTTISTTGYGDISAVSQAEMLCFITSAFLAAVTNAAIIGSKATSAAHKVRRHRFFVRRVTDTTHYLRERGVDAATQHRMLEYFSYIVQNDTIMYDLLMPLVRRAEIKREMYQPLLTVIDTLCFPLQSQLSEGFLFELAQRIQPHIYLPHDVIVHEGDVGDGLYIMHEGNARVVLSKHALSEEAKALPERLRKRGIFGARNIFLTQGHFFGELALMLPNQLRTASVVALGPVQCYSVASAEWASLLDHYYMLRAPVLNAFLERAYEMYPDARLLLERAKAERVLKIEALVDAELLARTAAVSVVTFDAHAYNRDAALAHGSITTGASREEDEPVSQRLKDSEMTDAQMYVLLEEDEW